MAELYSVLETQPWTYINQTGRTVDGFRVWFVIKAHPGMIPHFVDVPSLAPAIVKAQIDQLLKDIQSLMG